MAATCTTTTPALRFDLGSIPVGGELSQDVVFTGTCSSAVKLTYDVSWVDPGNLVKGTYTFSDNKDRVRMRLCYVSISSCYDVPYASPLLAKQYSWKLRLTYAPAMIGTISRSGYLRISFA